MIKPKDFSNELLQLSPKLQGCIWDLDGTLIINNEATALDQIGSVMKDHLLSEYGYKDKFCYRVYAGMPLPKIREAVEKRLQHLDVTLPENLEDEIRGLRKQSPQVGEKVVILPFFKTVLGAFKKAGVYQCIATGSEPDRAARYVHAAKLRTYFSQKAPYLFAGHKPNPSCYNMALESYNNLAPFCPPLDRQRVISFEDSISGVRAGVAAGVQVIGHLMANHISEDRKDDIAQMMLDAGAVDVIRYNKDAPKVLLHVLENKIPEDNFNLPYRPLHMRHQEQAVACRR